MLKHLLAVVLISAVPLAEAQVRVVESSPQSKRSGVAQPVGVGQPIESVNSQTSAYFELQSMKEEISQLRGMVEEQAHEIARLKQQQTDNYLDLDKRLSNLSAGHSGGNPVTAPPARSSQTSAPETNISNSVSGGALGDAEAYGEAYDLLKQRQIDSAITAFKDYLKRFPSGAYSGNAFYWLGEIYLLKDDLAQSRDWFKKLLDTYPNDRKVPDAKFKLGKVYHLLGDTSLAKPLLIDVSSGTGDSARLAKQYLQENF